MTAVDGWRAPGVGDGSSAVLAEALAGVAAAHDALELVVRNASCLSDSDVRTLLEEGARLRARVASVVATAAGEADRRALGDPVGARTTGAWWSVESRLTRRETHRLVRLGRSLAEPGFAPVAEALAAGRVHADQAAVIVAAVEAIPSRVEDLPSDAPPPAVIRALAVERLLDYAAVHDAGELKVLGRRILEVVAPEAAEAAEAKALADEEAAAERKVKLTLRDDGHGSTHGRFTIPVAVGQALRKQLLALADPANHGPDASPPAGSTGTGPTGTGPTGTGPTGTGPTGMGPDPAVGVGDKPRPLPVRLGWALIEWIERVPATALPTSGGTGATAVVTMSLSTLLGGLAAAALDTGTRISPGHARRLACEAGIIPTVLGGTSEVLDIGRTRRLHTKAQRVALALRDGGCTAQGCHMPPAACHAHHDHPWSQGGPTTIANGRLLCHRHHRLVHDSAYDTTRHPTPDNPAGTLTFHRRT